MSFYDDLLFTWFVMVLQSNSIQLLYKADFPIIRLYVMQLKESLHIRKANWISLHP
jgi:hypothetical protein